MTPAEIQGVVLFYVGLAATGLFVEFLRALIWVGLAAAVYKRVVKRK